MEVCYICQEEIYPQDLELGIAIKPCDCTAGIHRHCLIRWINSRNDTTPMICEICQKPYSIEPVGPVELVKPTEPTIVQTRRTTITRSKRGKKTTIKRITTISSPGMYEEHEEHEYEYEFYESDF